MKSLAVVSRILVGSIIGFSLLNVASPGASRAVATHETPGLAAAIDELFSHAFKPDGPGAAVIVAKDGNVVFRKGYGMANLELGVPVRPEMVFRLGSITKQFTAAAILMLARQGKLSVTDDITRFLPDFPTQGRRITIENLLTHTSGLKDYTSLPGWSLQWRKDMSPTDLIAMFRDKPPDFAPGERWSYSNSGYVLLGAIIEKVSGQTYKDFIEKQIFAPRV
jgi:CubicO group peptidase (beta-lactamase class C family)